MGAARDRHAAWADLLPAHALGALAGRERRALVRHLATCPACRRDLAALRETADLLVYAAPPACLDPAVKMLLRGRLCAIMRRHATSVNRPAGDAPGDRAGGTTPGAAAGRSPWRGRRWALPGRHRPRRGATTRS